MNPKARRIGSSGDLAHTYHAEIARDDEAGVWYVSGTDFPGLVAEADSERELIGKIRELVPELYELNRHLFGEPGLEAIPLGMTSRRLETISLASRSSRH